jgi:CcmD family protein
MGYLVAAYLILWIGMFGYLFWMSGALRGLRAELRDLRAAQGTMAEAVPEPSPVAPTQELSSTVPPVESLGR